MKKYFFLSAMFCLLFLTCKKDAKLASASDEIIQVNYGTSFNNCLGFCRRETIIKTGTISYTKQSFSTVPQTVSCTITLDDNGLNSIKSGFNVNTFFNFPVSYGCPDCADGGAEWIEIELGNGNKHKVIFEYNHVPAELNAYLTLLNGFGQNIPCK